MDLNRDEYFLTLVHPQDLEVANEFGGNGQFELGQTVVHDFETGMYRPVPPERTINPKIIYGRPDHGRGGFYGTSPAKRFPPFVYSTNKNGFLIHKVARVEFRWYEPHMNYLLRLDHPKATIHCVCGQMFFQRSVNMCVVPRGDAVRCGPCHGEPRPFRVEERGSQKIKEAKLRKGCVIDA